jgi:hypothetical protein
MVTIDEAKKKLLKQLQDDIQDLPTPLKNLLNK